MADVGKRAVHVKWAGKTIALGTFPTAIADEKCSRAKALTRAWRSTMRPKPSREWVMLELERLGVRVVSSGRASGRASAADGGGSDKEDGIPAAKGNGTPSGGTVQRNATPSGGTVPRNATPSGDAVQQAKNSQGWSTSAPNESDFDTMMQQRRSSSIGYSMMEDMKRRSSSLGLGQSAGMEDVVMPPHRPLVGGASAAAYEAARADHYSSLAAKKRLSSDTQRRSSLGAGGMMSPGGLGNFNASSNQHYEMLKLHHMNLLNEIQETTLMMNLYQQQQLQQQRLELQEQESRLEHSMHTSPQMKMQSQQGSGGMDFQGGGMGGSYPGGSRGMGGMGMGRSPSLGLGDIGRSPSLGLGGSSGSLGFGHGSSRGSIGMGGSSSSIGDGGQQGGGQVPSKMNQQPAGDGLSTGNSQRDIQQELLAQEEEQRILEERLAKVKEEIAQRQRETEALEASFGPRGDLPEKRKSHTVDDSDQDSPAAKKRKSDDSSGVASCEV